MVTPVRLSYREHLAGHFAVGVDTPRLGAERGRVDGTRLNADLVVTINDLDAWTSAPVHRAHLAGTITLAGVADRASIIDGTIELCIPDREVGIKQIRYDAPIRGSDGALYRWSATKFIRPGRATFHERATAYARLLTVSGSDDAANAASSRIVAAGVVASSVWDVLVSLRSIHADGLSWHAAVSRMLAFWRHELATPLPIFATG